MTKFTKNKINLRQKLKELERPSVDKLITKDANGKTRIDTISGNTELENIDTIVGDTAVDVFVYDTRKDSDGGAWRKRTQHTSWYNETLNTSIRGSRREFPAVAVIVAEATQVTIYDGDDPDLPMWMVTNSGGSAHSTDNILGDTNTQFKSISMVNGLLCVANYTYAFRTLDFIKEEALRFHSGSLRKYAGNVSERDAGKGTIDISSIDTRRIVNAQPNDVAMTVLPNAPIDSTTGLPVPTIAVATDGGVSVIKDDGTVFDTVATSAGYIISRKVEFEGEYLHIIQDPSLIYTYKISAFNQDRSGGTLTGYTGLSFYSGWVSGSGAASATKLSVKDDSTINIGHANTGLSRLYPDYTYSSNSLDTDSGRMVSIATTSYNTGWMIGDTEGAFLSDTDTTNLVDTNLVSNGTFDTDTSGWSSSGSITVTHDSGRLKMVSGAGNPLVYTAVTCVVGKRYYFQADFEGSVSFHAGPNASSSGDVAYIPYGSYGSSTTRHCFFVATATTMYLVPHVIGTGNTGYIDNVICKLADHDRTRNGAAKANVGGVNGLSSGLAVYGTITKSPVATGAELVSYGGFSNNNYLRQPYNSDLRFEQNDFSIMFWIYDTGVNEHTTIISKDEREFDISRLVAAYGNKLRIYTRNSNEDLRTPDSASALPFNRWVCVCVTYTDGNTKRVYIDGELDVTITGTNGEYDIDSTSYGLNIGVRNTGGTNAYSATGAKLALLRIGSGAPSAEQVKKMYNDEKVLFQENAACTLYGSSDAVTALAYDDSNDLLHVGTSSGRSDFQGLRRINNTTTAVTTAMSASNGLVAEQ